MIEQINKSKVNYWLDSNPYNIMDMSTSDIINFLLIYHTMDINDFIWLLGQDKSKMTKPYHRTLTNHY